MSEQVPKNDIQSQQHDVRVLAGISNLRVIFKSDNWKLPVTVRILADTQRNRGVHMSRLVETAFSNLEAHIIEDAMTIIQDEIKQKHSTNTIECTVNFPYEDQWVDIKITLTHTWKYEFTLQGITACPCSKEECGIGHMQRAKLVFSFETDGPIIFEKMCELLFTCFSAKPKECLKRGDEAKLIITAQENAKFVEDVIRTTIETFKKEFSSKEYTFSLDGCNANIYVESQESIHSHNAIAYWSGRIV